MDRVGGACLLVLCSRIGIAALDGIARGAIARCEDLPRSKKPYMFTRVDTACVAFNGLVVENAFLYWVWQSGLPLPGAARWIPLYIGALLLVDDALYTLYHRWMHTNKWLYRHVHARHHRVKDPQSGYLDASMEHPLEMIGALVLHALSIRLLSPDIVSVGVHILIKAVASCINHSGKRCRVWCYDSMDHAQHHARLTTCFHQILPVGRVLGCE